MQTGSEEAYDKGRDDGMDAANDVCADELREMVITWRKQALEQRARANAHPEWGNEAREEMRLVARTLEKCAESAAKMADRWDGGR